MDRFARLLFVPLLCCYGCGTSSEPAAQQDAPSPTQSVAASVPDTPPTDVVSQFLDEIRRGGQDSPANRLLTSKAQSELKRIGRTVQPIGSPDARFQVTRFENVPDEPNSALVHSIWTEPNGDNTTANFQVVWAVEKEMGNWRISGLVMEVDPNESPVIIDFENGEMMAQILSAPDFQQSGTGANPSVGAPGGMAAEPGAANVTNRVPGSVAPAGGPSQAAVTDPNLSR